MSVSASVGKWMRREWVDECMWGVRINVTFYLWSENLIFQIHVNHLWNLRNKALTPFEFRTNSVKNEQNGYVRIFAHGDSYCTTRITLSRVGRHYICVKSTVNMSLRKGLFTQHGRPRWIKDVAKKKKKSTWNVTKMRWFPSVREVS